MNKYIVGIDGGGTKTLGVLFTTDGKEVRRVIKGPSNISSDEKSGIHTIKEVLSELITDDVVKDVEFIQMGIAGVSKMTNKEGLVKELEDLYHTSISIDTDALIALYSVKKDSDDHVIMVLGGTGSVVMVSEEDHVNIIGGFGHLLGDQGSGYHLAISALKCIIKQFENGEAITELSIAILNELNLTDYQMIKQFVYNSSKSDIASLSQFIASIALSGNEEAKQLFINEGLELARQTLIAFNKIKTEQHTIIGLRGGFLLNAPLVKETLKEALSKQIENFTFDTTVTEPVIGAYYLGKRKQLKR